MRLILILLILLVAVVGAWFAASNAASVALDFHFFRLQAPLGLALLVSLLVGWTLGGLLAGLGPVPRLRRELRRANARLRAARTPPAETDRA